MGRPLINPDDINDQELVNALRVLAISILMADGDRDHSNQSGLSVGQVLVLRDAILCAATKLEAANASIAARLPGPIEPV